MDATERCGMRCPGMRAVNLRSSPRFVSNHGGVWWQRSVAQAPLCQLSADVPVQRCSGAAGQRCSRLTVIIR